MDAAGSLAAVVGAATVTAAHFFYALLPRNGVPVSEERFTFAFPFFYIGPVSVTCVRHTGSHLYLTKAS